MSDKLTIEFAEAIVDGRQRCGLETGKAIAKQLLDTMRENERLRDALHMVGNILHAENINSAFIDEALSLRNRRMTDTDTVMLEMAVAKAINETCSVYDGEICIDSLWKTVRAAISAVNSYKHLDAGGFVAQTSSNGVETVHTTQNPFPKEGDILKDADGAFGEKDKLYKLGEDPTKT